ncbi:MAG: DUF3078 domain-containing protein [Bacteroidetes bacterium]|nr:DUF3078 domain-containing protein [Bacteroidota bacterium]
MRRIIALLSFLVVSAAAFGQITIQQFREQYNRTFKNPFDTIPEGWRLGGIYNLTVNQGALSNWAAGGDNSSISIATMLSTYALFKKGHHSWDNTLDMAYGLVNTTSLGTRKSDDRIDLLSKYGYSISKQVNFSGLFNFRSQFTRGYSYLDENTKVLTSSFAAPAYVLFSLGFDYKITPHLSVFASPATTRWVIVNNDSLASAGAYGVDSGRRSRLEFGSFVSIKYINEFNKTTSYRTRMDLFSNYLRRPQNINLYWTNVLSVKAFKMISINISLDLIYDNDIKSVKSDGSSGGPALQIKEVLGVGLSYEFNNKSRYQRKPAVND